MMIKLVKDIKLIVYEISVIYENNRTRFRVQEKMDFNDDDLKSMEC